MKFPQLIDRIDGGIEQPSETSKVLANYMYFLYILNYYYELYIDDPVLLRINTNVRLGYCFPWR